MGCAGGGEEGGCCGRCERKETLRRTLSDSSATLSGALNTRDSRLGTLSHRSFPECDRPSNIGSAAWGVVVVVPGLLSSPEICLAKRPNTLELGGIPARGPISTPIGNLDAATAQ